MWFSNSGQIIFTIPVFQTYSVSLTFSNSPCVTAPYSVILIILELCCCSVRLLIISFVFLIIIEDLT